MQIPISSGTHLNGRFASALLYAHQLHANQIRKGGNIPYIAHLLSVTALVIEDGGTEDEAIAALLHDAVEDQGGTPTLLAIQQQFGSTVATIVEGCTDTATSPKPPWRDRKENHLKVLQQASPSVRRVTLADTLHNARSIYTDLRQIGDQLWTRFNGGREGTLWYYRSLLSVLKTNIKSPLEIELEKTVTEIESLAETIHQDKS